MKARRSGTTRLPAKNRKLNAPVFGSRDEAKRLAELREFNIVDTSPEADFDDMAMLAAHVCEAPVALITFIEEDRQWFKSRIGLDLREIARDIAFCAYTMEQSNVLVVPDAAADKRFADNPLVTAPPHIRFYAGAPLISSNGHVLGTICVFDTVPRELKPDQELALRVLSRHVMTQLELRRSDARRRAAEEALERSHARLERSVEKRTSELQKARAETNASRREIAQLIERVSDGVIALDTDWHYTYVNEKAAELLGKHSEELLGEYIWKVFPEGVGQPVYHAYYQAVAEQRPITIEAYYAPWDRWFENRIYPSENGLSIFFQDVTDKKRAEGELLRERRLSDAIITCLPGCFYLFDEEGRFLRWNAETERITGLSAEQFATRHPLDVIAPPDRPAIERGIAKAFSEGDATTEARIQSTDGTATWHLCTGKRITIEGKPCVVGLAIDISERKRAEELLRDAQTRLEVAVRASGVGLWDWDIVNDRAIVSQEWRDQLGFDDAEFANPFELWERRLHPEDREKAVHRLKTYLAHPTSEYHSEARLRDNNGHYRWIFTRAQLLRNEQGQPLRMLGCHIDVTMLRKTEERLREQREQLRALAKHLNSVREEEAGRIARELHDELGAALTGLKIDVNRLSQRLEKDSVALLREHIRTTLSSIDTTIQSVRKICLDLRPAILDQLGLSAAVEWLVSEFQKRTGISCDLHQPESISIASNCATTIFRIFQELLTNVARHADATRVSIKIRQEPDKVVLEVTDNGRGLPDEALTRRDRFGLLSVRERALAVGGKVDFHSAKNRGTQVVLCVPIE